MMGSSVLGGLVFWISDSTFSAAFDVLIKIAESYQPQIPSPLSSLSELYSSPSFHKERIFFFVLYSLLSSPSSPPLSPPSLCPSLSCSLAHEKIKERVFIPSLPLFPLLPLSFFSSPPLASPVSTSLSLSLSLVEPLLRGGISIARGTSLLHRISFV